MMNKQTLLLLVSFLMLGGCAAKAQYACGVPTNGVGCQPMSTTHQQLSDGTLSSLYTEPFAPKAETQPHRRQGRGRHSESQRESNMQASQSGNRLVSIEPRQQGSIISLKSHQAILSKPREMRIWFDRFTDPEGDLHDESFVFIRIDKGHWLIDNKPVLY